MEKQRPQERPPEENNPERDDVHLSANRCPYCHEDVQISALDWVACRSCQARHHKDCWTELQCCGACKEERYLADVTEPTQPSIDIQQAPALETLTVDTNTRQRGFAKFMAVMMAIAVGIAIALSVTGSVNFGGPELTFMIVMTISVWLYSRTGIDPMGFGQPIGQKKSKAAKNSKNPSAN